MARLPHPSGLLALCIGLQACAPWVWNERYLLCEDVAQIDQENWTKPMTFRIAAYDAADTSDEPCEAEMRGLFKSRIRTVGEEGQELEVTNVGLDHIRHAGDALELESVFLDWESCYAPVEDGGPSVLDGCAYDDLDVLETIAGVVEIDGLRSPTASHSLRDLQIDSANAGLFSFSADGMHLACTRCTARGTFAQEQPVEIRLDSPTGDIDLCFEEHASDVSVLLTGTAPLEPLKVRLDFTTAPARVAVDTAFTAVPQGEDGVIVEVALPPNPEGYAFAPERIASRYPTDPEGIPVALSEGTAPVTFDVVPSAGLCPTGIVQWDAD